MKVQFRRFADSIDNVKINGKLSELIKTKVIQSLEKQGIQKDVVITKIDVVDPDNVNGVKLKVNFLYIEETIPILFEKSEFDRLHLHYIDPDRIKFNTFKINNVDIPEELFQVIKEKLTYELIHGSKDYGDFRKCEEIRVIGIQRENYGEPDEINLVIEILYNCPIDGHMTPDMTRDIYLTFDKSEFPLFKNEDEDEDEDDDEKDI